MYRYRFSYVYLNIYIYICRYIYIYKYTLLIHHIMRMSSPHSLSSPAFALNMSTLARKDMKEWENNLRRSGGLAAFDLAVFFLSLRSIQNLLTPYFACICEKENMDSRPENSAGWDDSNGLGETATPPSHWGLLLVKLRRIGAGGLMGFPFRFLFVCERGHPIFPKPHKEQQNS